MTRSQPTRLLNKIVLLFLLIIVVAFSISVFTLILKANQHVKNSVERSYSHKEEQVAELLDQNPDLTIYRETLIRKLKPEELPHQSYDVDTVMLEEDHEVPSLHRLRYKAIEVNGEHYELVMRKNIEDFQNLKADILQTLILVFILLSVILFVFAIFLSRFLFQPFNYILEQMQGFRVGEDFSFRPAKTSTREFISMQTLYHEMVIRAEKDYRRLKEYTENMSHEFQTPLAVIRNKTENLIADEEVMQTHSKSVKAIYDEANHLSKLSQTLKLLTKIENNEYVNTERMHSSEVITDHIDKLHELARLKNIRIKSELSPLHTFEMDPFLLEIVLKNLIQNAILYASQESEIRIQTTADSFTICNVSDHKGVKGNDIFKRFSKGKEHSTSLGLGLAIVKKICELNSLEISYSHVDTRHCFSIISQK